MCRYYHRNSEPCLKTLNYVVIVVHVLWGCLSLFDIYFINFHSTVYFPFLSISFPAFVFISFLIGIGYFYAQKQFQTCYVWLCLCFLHDDNHSDGRLQSHCLYKPYIVFMLLTILIYPISPSLYYHTIITLYIRQYEWYSTLFEFQEKIDDIEQLIHDFQITIDPHLAATDQLQRDIKTFNDFTQIIGHHLVQILARPSLHQLKQCTQNHVVQYLAHVIPDIASHMNIKETDIERLTYNHCEHESNVLFVSYLKRRSFHWCYDFICCKLLMGRVLLLFTLLCVAFWIMFGAVIAHQLSEDAMYTMLLYCSICHGMSFIFMIVLVYISIHLEIQMMWKLHSWLHPEGEIGIYAAIHKYLRLRLLNAFVEIVSFIYKYEMICNYIGDAWFRNTLLQYLGMQQLIIPEIKKMIQNEVTDESKDVNDNNETTFYRDIVSRSDVHITTKFNGFGPIPDAQKLLDEIEVLVELYKQLLLKKSDSSIDKFYLNTVLL
eukprot:119061_1